MKNKQQIKKRIEELRNNKFYKIGKSKGKIYSKIGTPLWREIHAAIKELEWVLEGHINPLPKGRGLLNDETARKE